MAFPGQSGRLVGHTAAPGYPGSLTAGPGTLTAGTTYSFMNWDDLPVIPANVKFFGCRIRSNWVDGWNIKLDNDGAEFRWCTICPSAVSVVPNAAWPAAGLGLDIDGSTVGTYEPYMIGHSQGYQYGIISNSKTLLIEDSDIWGFGNAITLDGTSQQTIRRCWIHDGANPGTGASGYHTDGPGHLDGSGCSNVLIEDCTIASLGNTNGIAFQAGTYSNITVRRCYLSGFGYLVDIGHGTSGNTGLTFTDNTIATDISWTYGPLYTNFAANFSTAGSTWRRNRLSVYPGSVPRSTSSPSFSSADNNKFVLPGISFSTTDFTGGGGGFGDVVQSNSGTSALATTTPTLPNPTTAGSLVVLTFASDAYNATVSAGWTESAEMEQQTNHGGYLWWLIATAGMTIPSYTIGSAVRSAWTLVEYSGPFDVTSYDGSQGQFNTTLSLSYTTANITPSAGNRLLVAGLNGDRGPADLGTWASITNSFFSVDQSLLNGAVPRLVAAQLRRVVTADGTTAYSTGGTLTGAEGAQTRTATIISFAPPEAAAGGTIAFRSQTSVPYAAGRVTTTLTPPAGLTDGDILIATLLIARGTTPFTPSLPAGFAEFGTATQVTDGSLVADLHIYWKRAASESGDYLFTTGITAHNTEGLMKAYSGCLASGTPLGATSNNTGSGSAASGTSITTTAANSWLLYEAHDWTASGTLAPPTGMTERYDSLVYSADQLRTTAAATGTRSQTNANSGAGRWAVRMVELLAEAPPPSTGYMKVWNGTAWVEKPVKVWTGAAWVQKPVKFWNGTAWVVA